MKLKDLKDMLKNSSNWKVTQFGKELSREEALKIRGKVEYGNTWNGHVKLYVMPAGASWAYVVELTLAGTMVGA